MTRRVTILKVYTDDYYDYVTNSFTNAVINAEFQEISDRTFNLLNKSIRQVPRDNEDYRYLLVELPEQKAITEQLINDITEYTRKLEEKEQERIRKAEEKKELKKQQALERKRIQLEKLKKELGE